MGEENGLVSYLRDNRRNALFEKTESNVSLENKKFEYYSLRWQLPDGASWNHRVLLSSPKTLIPHSQLFFLSIAGSGNLEGERNLLDRVSSEVGIPGAILADVPNRLPPNMKDDELLARSIAEFEKTGDNNKPIIFPMVNSVRLAMDSISTALKARFDTADVRFVLYGASKRGWTAYLLAAQDDRVAGLAPRVFDMLNMKQQIASAQRTFGKQSEKLRVYEELGLIERIDSGRIRELRE